MKDIINIIIGKEDISVLDKYHSVDTEILKRYKEIVCLFIHYGKILYQKGLLLEQLITITQNFFQGYSSNPILANYYTYGENQDKIDDEVKKMIKREMDQLNVFFTLDEISMENAISSESGIEQNKTLSLSNGHPTGTETGFASPILLAILTATIEITTLVYIFMQAME